MNEFNLQIFNDLLKLYIEKGIPKTVLSEVIKLIKRILNNLSQVEYFPASAYLFFKQFAELNLNKTFSFITNCCGFRIFNFKSLDYVICGDCNKEYTSREILSERNYFLRFSLTEQLTFLLEHFDLTDQYPGNVFRQFLGSKQDICALTLFIDGVRMSFGNFELTNFFIKVNNLDCNIYTRTFLHACSISQSKPDVDFILTDLVEELNFLFQNGIFIKRYQKKIYPVVTMNLFDLVARHSLLCHISFLTKYGCIRCLALGERCGHSHLFLPEEEAELRTLELQRGVFRLIKSGKPIPKNGFLGVKGISPITNIEYQNFLICTTPEPMHLGGGVLKTNFVSFLKLSDSLCSMSKNSVNVLERRIKNFSKFTFNSIFKRKIGEFSQIPNKKWKTNQIFQFFFFVFPIVFENLIDDDVYTHNILLLYIFYNLWSKSEDQLELSYIEKLLKLYSVLIRSFYPATNYTPNNHQLSKHLVEHYQNHGKLSLNNGFIFEHLNGIVNQQAKSAFGVLEQIADRSELSFKNNIKCINILTKSRDFKSNSASNITRISNDFFSVSSTQTKTKCKDCFVMTSDNRFYKVTKFHRYQDCIFFTGQKFNIIREFFKILDFSDEIIPPDLLDLHFDTLKIDYIYDVQLTTQTIDLNVNTIKEIVLYCPKFAPNRSTFLDESKGLIFRDILGIHN